MTTAPETTVDELRRLPPAEMARVGDQCLRDHLQAQAIVAHCKYGPLGPDNLDRFLADPDCLRHPVRLLFEFGDMALHQFAQPGPDPEDPTGHSRILCLRPTLRSRPELVALALAYLLPVLNYGEVVTDDHCLAYGATLQGQTVDEFYDRICRLADFVGAETRLQERATACDRA